MSVMAAVGGGYAEASSLYASHGGEWVEIPLGAKAWTRPDHWLATSVGNGEQKIQMLVRIGGVGSPETERVMALNVQGAYTVNWGDGTAPQNFGSNAPATHLYDPTTLTSPEFETGYKQALITITPQSGNLTFFTLNVAYYTGKTIKSNAVEVVIGPSTLTAISFTPSPLLERVELRSRLILAGGSGLFSTLSVLREVVGELEITGTVASSMFNNCFMLEKYPTFIMPNVTNIGSMFVGNYLMVEPPPFPTAQITNFSSTFQSCISMKRLPPGFSMAEATTAASMFSACNLLEELPTLNTAKVTNALSMFSTCYSLKEVSLTSTALVTNVNTMFNSCNVLRKVGVLDFSAVTSAANLTSVFAACNRLSEIQWAAGKGPLFSFALPTMQDGTGLNNTYTNLPTVTGQTVTVTNVPGTLGDNPAIATAKGWTVTGS